MSKRYYSDTPIVDDSIVLGGAEAHHMMHVMRTRLGDQVVVFDGTGCEFVAELIDKDRNAVTLRILSSERVDRELPFQLIIAVALPKGDRLDWLVQKTVELGVGQLVPMKTQRSVAIPTEKTVRRIERAIIEASKQCGRNVLMQIHPPLDFPVLTKESTLGQNRLIADPGQTHSGDELFRNHGRSTCVAVGPEGGFTREEIDLSLANGWRPFSLGPRTLRVETAAVAAASVLATMPTGRTVQNGESHVSD